ncbi:MAG: carboxylating nicotinate-nucleotide diphosphorylase [Marinilabiliales bacterium]|nr:MAG: carboxylating nicotinate-nucleotide diphosphorylase [Marinilabiliales bacterium]
MSEFANTGILIDIALQEDLGDNGDITSGAIFVDETDEFVLVSKDKGILCGLDLFAQVINRVDKNITIARYFSDGDPIGPGNVVAGLQGSVRSILKAERTAINFVSLLSATATSTSEFVRETGGRAVILDTRKTIPGFRELQKYAVRCGGGSNHRMGLYDMVMIKDNHIDAAGGIRDAVSKAREKWGSRFMIEVETRNLEEVREAIECGVDRIMFDNMTNAMMKEAVKLTGGRCETEASGNMTPGKVPAAASTGVTFISAGTITSSVKAFDFSLKKKP